MRLIECSTQNLPVDFGIRINEKRMRCEKRTGTSGIKHFGGTCGHRKGRLYYFTCGFWRATSVYALNFPYIYTSAHTFPKGLGKYQIIMFDNKSTVMYWLTLQIAWINDGMLEWNCGTSSIMTLYFFTLLSIFLLIERTYWRVKIYPFMFISLINSLTNLWTTSNFL